MRFVTSQSFRLYLQIFTFFIYCCLLQRCDPRKYIFVTYYHLPYSSYLKKIAIENFPVCSSTFRKLILCKNLTHIFLVLPVFIDIFTSRLNYDSNVKTTRNFSNFSQTLGTISKSISPYMKIDSGRLAFLIFSSWRVGE